MPIYEYRCEQGHEFEVLQRMSDGPVSTCTTCSAPVQRVFRPIAVHFKGSGFYNTDYGTRKRAREKEGEAKAENSSKTSDSSSSSDSGTKTETKPSESKPSESKQSESKKSESTASTSSSS